MTTIIDGTAGITFPNSTVQASAGQVLQVVNATTSTEASSSSATFADTGLTASIAPKFATSKILVLVSQNGVEKETNNNGVNLQLVKNSTVISQIAVAASFTNSTGTSNTSSSFSYLDSPATTSSTIYKTQFASNGGTSLVKVQLFSNVSTITLLEIAA